jgi:hypothetical protein
VTIPSERTRAVLYTKDFLFTLLDPKATPRVPREVRQQASRCLRHYPGTYDLVQAHRGAPNTFGKPDAS